MREIRTYGLKRGPPHRQHLGGALYSTRGNRLFHSAATFQPLHRPPRPGLPTLRPRSGQPCSPFETGVLLVRRPARRTPVRRRGRVLSKPPRLKGFRPACGSALGLRPRLSPRYARPSLRSAATRPRPRVATLVEFGGTAFAFLRARRPATARFRPPPGASCAAHPAIRRRRGSASSSRGRAASETPNRRPRTRFCRPPHPRSRLTSR